MLILFQPVCFSSSGSDHFNIRKINSKFSSTVSIPSAPSCLCFSHPLTLFLQGLRFLYQVSILFMWRLFILVFECSYPVILMKILMELQVRHSSFFSSPVDLIQALVLSILLFFFFQCFSYAGAPLNHPSLAIKLFRSAQDISKIRVSTLHSFKLFRDWYLIQVI